MSHELRTPLTLMLGPLEELLRRDGADPAALDLLSVTYRNGLRLLKLVNTLLDFSRIEAGRVQANYVAVDLCAFTAELAATFRAAVENAGLELIVDCPPLADAVYVDGDMWEKIVLNLLSNAFKCHISGPHRRPHRYSSWHVRWHGRAHGRRYRDGKFRRTACRTFLNASIAWKARVEERRRALASASL